MINKPIDLSSLAYIDVSTGCWLWRGTLSSSTGYGAIMRQRPRFKEKINVD